MSLAEVLLCQCWVKVVVSYSSANMKGWLLIFHTPDSATCQAAGLDTDQAAAADWDLFCFRCEEQNKSQDRNGRQGLAVMGLLVTLVLSGLGLSLAHPQTLDIDTSQLPQQDINTLNCFDLVEDSQWDSLLGLNLTTASLSVLVEEVGPLSTCLTRQTVTYLVSVVGDTNTTQFLLSCRATTR